MTSSSFAIIGRSSGASPKSLSICSLSLDTEPDTLDGKDFNSQCFMFNIFIKKKTLNVTDI